MRAPRIILLGVEKIGKSTFAASSDNPIMIPIKREEGVDDLAVSKFPVCQTFNDLMQCFSTLYTSEHNFGTVVVDSASALEPLIWDDTCHKNGNADSIEKVNGGYGKGYIEALKQWGLVVEALDALRATKNMSSIIIGHVKVKRFDDPNGSSYDQYQFDLNDKASALLYKWADLILFCNTKVVVTTEKLGFNKEKHRGIDIAEGQRFLYTQKRPSHPGGGRGVYGRIPYELPLSWASFINAVASVSN